MSELSITGYFTIKRMKLTDQRIHSDQGISALIRLVPNWRYRPVCHGCGSPATTVHSKGHRRHVRDLNLAGAQVWLDVEYRKIWCVCGGVRVEQIDCFPMPPT